jgi:hypothetical protein
MSRYEVLASGLLSGLHDEASHPSPDEYKGIVHDVMKALLAVDDLAMPSVSGSAHDCLLRVRAYVDAPKPEAAAALAGVRIRSAAHAAGLGTPGWPTGLMWRISAAMPEATLV